MRWVCRRIARVKVAPVDDFRESGVFCAFRVAGFDNQVPWNIKVSVDNVVGGWWFTQSKQAVEQVFPASGTVDNSYLCRFALPWPSKLSEQQANFSN